MVNTREWAKQSRLTRSLSSAIPAGPNCKLCTTASSNCDKISLDNFIVDTELIGSWSLYLCLYLHIQKPNPAMDRVDLMESHLAYVRIFSPCLQHTRLIKNRWQQNQVLIHQVLRIKRIWWHHLHISTHFYTMHHMFHTHLCNSFQQCQVFLTAECETNECVNGPTL